MDGSEQTGSENPERQAERQAKRQRVRQHTRDRIHNRLWGWPLPEGVEPVNDAE